MSFIADGAGNPSSLVIQALKPSDYFLWNVVILDRVSFEADETRRWRKFAWNLRMHMLCVHFQTPATSYPELGS
jgi:hypothetical protein